MLSVPEHTHPMVLSHPVTDDKVNRLPRNFYKEGREDKAEVGRAGAVEDLAKFAQRPGTQLLQPHAQCPV